MKIKIEKMFINDKDKNGKPFVSAKGQPFKKITIQSDGKWYSGFAGQWNSSWKVGDEIECEVEEKQFNGNTYYNLKSPARGGNLDQFTSTLQMLVDNTNKIIKLLESQNIDKVTPEEDIPF